MMIKNSLKSSDSAIKSDYAAKLEKKKTKKPKKPHLGFPKLMVFKIAFKGLLICILFRILPYTLLSKTGL